MTKEVGTQYEPISTPTSVDESSNSSDGASSQNSQSPSQIDTIHNINNICGSENHRDIERSKAKKQEEIKRFMCSMCKTRYSHKASLHNHLFKVHRVESPLDAYIICLSDWEARDTLGAYKAFRAQQRQITSFSCPICLQAFRWDTQVRRHMLNAHPILQNSGGNVTNENIFDSESDPTSPRSTATSLDEYTSLPPLTSFQTTTVDALASRNEMRSQEVDDTEAATTPGSTATPLDGPISLPPSTNCKTTTIDVLSTENEMQTQEVDDAHVATSEPIVEQPAGNEQEQIDIRIGRRMCTLRIERLCPKIVEHYLRRDHQKVEEVIHEEDAQTVSAAAAPPPPTTSDHDMTAVVTDEMKCEIKMPRRPRPPQKPWSRKYTCSVCPYASQRRSTVLNHTRTKHKRMRATVIGKYKQGAIKQVNISRTPATELDHTHVHTDSHCQIEMVNDTDFKHAVILTPSIVDQALSALSIPEVSDTVDASADTPPSTDTQLSDRQPSAVASEVSTSTVSLGSTVSHATTSTSQEQHSIQHVPNVVFNSQPVIKNEPM